MRADLGRAPFDPLAEEVQHPGAGCRSPGCKSVATDILTDREDIDLRVPSAQIIRSG
jgi:hypothetical protein